MKSFKQLVVNSYLFKISWNILLKILSKNPKKLKDFLYKKNFGHSIDWGNPRDLNEWINWLQENTDIQKWVQLADKYEVRNYIKEKGLNEILVPFYGVWDKPEDLRLDIGEEKIIIKANNGCGDRKIFTTEANQTFRLDSESIKHYKKAFKTTGTILSGENHYQHIPPKIIAEKFLSAENQSFPSTSLIDYKFWCINGEPQSCMVLFDRNESNVKMGLFDMDWNNISENIIGSSRCKIICNELPKPKQWDKMKEVATALSQGIPQVRVDLYEVDNKVYFGEMTFTSAAGRMQYFKPIYLKQLGDKISQEFAKGSYENLLKSSLK